MRGSRLNTLHAQRTERVHGPLPEHKTTGPVSDLNNEREYFCSRIRFLTNIHNIYYNQRNRIILLTLYTRPFPTPAPPSRRRSPPAPGRATPCII